MSTLSGKVTRIGDTQSFGSNGFKKKQIVVTTEDKYPQPIGVDFVKDKIDKLSNISVGDEVSIEYNLRGNDWDDPKSGETKNFVSLEGWRIEKTGQAQENQPNELPVGGDDINGEDDLNLPF